MKKLGTIRYVVADGIPGENDEAPDEYWVLRQVLTGIEEFEPGFPVLDFLWEADGYEECGPYTDRAEASAAAAARNRETRPDRCRRLRAVK